MKRTKYNHRRVIEAVDELKEICSFHIQLGCSKCPFYIRHGRKTNCLFTNSVPAHIDTGITIDIIVERLYLYYESKNKEVLADKQSSSD